jgi:hypothetical protein
MEQPLNPIKVKYKYAADYGLILGGYLAAFYVLQLIFKGNVFMNILNTLGMLGVPFLCYYLTKKYRDVACGGFLRFGQVWSFGVWLFLFAGLIMSVVYFVHFQFLDPNFISDIFNQSLLMLEQMKYDQEALDLFAKNGFPSPIQMVVYYLFAYVVCGAILFLFISALLAKKNPNDIFGPGSSDNTYEPYQEKQDKPESNS